jgi:hypothetical protein
MDNIVPTFKIRYLLVCVIDAFLVLHNSIYLGRLGQLNFSASSVSVEEDADVRFSLVTGKLKQSLRLESELDSATLKGVYFNPEYL